MSELHCSNCYWWDASAARTGSDWHHCHEPDTVEGAGGAIITTAVHVCESGGFRPKRDDDPATTWNRKQPGKRTRSPRAEKDPIAQKRGKASKRKGKKGEKEWGEYVVEHIGGEFIARGGDRDVQFIGNALGATHSEVKRHKRFSIIAHCRQSREDAIRHGLSRALVAFRADCAPGERKEWRVVPDADDYLADMNELRDLRTIVEKDAERAQDEQD